MNFVYALCILDRHKWSTAHIIVNIIIPHCISYYCRISERLIPLLDVVSFCYPFLVCACNNKGKKPPKIILNKNTKKCYLAKLNSLVTLVIRVSVQIKSHKHFR